MGFHFLKEMTQDHPTGERNTPRKTMRSSSCTGFICPIHPSNRMPPRQVRRRKFDSEGIDISNGIAIPAIEKAYAKREGLAILRYIRLMVATRLAIDLLLVDLFGSSLGASANTSLRNFSMPASRTTVPSFSESVEIDKFSKMARGNCNVLWAAGPSR